MLASEETIEREFGVYKEVRDNYPQNRKRSLRAQYAAMLNAAIKERSFSRKVASMTTLAMNRFILH